MDLVSPYFQCSSICVYFKAKYFLKKFLLAYLSLILKCLGVWGRYFWAELLSQVKTYRDQNVCKGASGQLSALPIGKSKVKRQPVQFWGKLCFWPGWPASLCELTLQRGLSVITPLTPNTSTVGVGLQQMSLQGTQFSPQPQLVRANLQELIKEELTGCEWVFRFHRPKSLFY